MNKIQFTLSLFLLVFLFDLGFTQKVDTLRSRKNLIELHTSIQNCFDHGGFLGPKGYWNPKNITMGWGVGYMRQIKKRHQIGVAANFVSSNDLFWNFMSEPQKGAIIARKLLFVELRHTYGLVHKGRLQLLSIAGLQFRTGSEEELVLFDPWYPLTARYRLHSLGLMGGLRGTIALPWNFQLGAEVKCSYFFVGNQIQVNGPTDVKDRASCNMIRMQLGLGFSF